VHGNSDADKLSLARHVVGKGGNGKIDACRPEAGVF
jgi:hypothetical protein